MRAFSNWLYYRKSPQDRYQRAWQRECWNYECIPYLWKKAGVLTLLGDCLKCVVAIVIVRMVYGNSMNTILPLLTLYAALGCILGHNFPISMEFRGGKGIAASVGMIIAFDWRIFIACAVVFLHCFLRRIMYRFALLVHMRWLLFWSLFLDIWENTGWISHIQWNFIL